MPRQSKAQKARCAAARRGWETRRRRAAEAEAKRQAQLAKRRAAAARRKEENRAAEARRQAQLAKRRAAAGKREEKRLAELEKARKAAQRAARSKARRKLGHALEQLEAVRRSNPSGLDLLPGPGPLYKNGVHGQGKEWHDGPKYRRWRAIKDQVIAAMGVES